MRLIDADGLFDYLTDQLEKERGAYTKGYNNGLNIARSALHDKNITPTIATLPNNLLTLEELREMDKEWVWISDLDKTPPSIARHAQLVYHTERGFRTRKFYLSAEAYGKTWLAYRRKPEEIPKRQTNICTVTGGPCCWCNPGPCGSRKQEEGTT